MTSPSNVCLITSRKLPRQQFEFSLKVKVMRSIQAISINLFYLKKNKSTIFKLWVFCWYSPLKKFLNHNNKLNGKTLQVLKNIYSPLHCVQNATQSRGDFMPGTRICSQCHCVALFLFFSKSKHTMFKSYESERYNSISNTNSFFSKCPNCMKDTKKIFQHGM